MAIFLCDLYQNHPQQPLAIYMSTMKHLDDCCLLHYEI